MQTKPRHIHVQMPDKKLLNVTYYCSDLQLNEKEKNEHTQLYIQLDDCICTLKIEKSVCRRQDILENIVQNKVIISRGHLC